MMRSLPSGGGATGAAPNAIRPIEDLVPLLYPGVKVSYGTIQQMLVEAEGRAARFNAQVSLGGVDLEISQGEPVLAGVDLEFVRFCADVLLVVDWLRRRGIAAAPNIFEITHFRRA